MDSQFQMMMVMQCCDPLGIGEILDFFDASVENGSLKGTGLGRWARARLSTMRRMIVAAGECLEEGLIEEACLQLQDTFDRCDGEATPPDFVEGDAALELSHMVLDLMTSLGF